MKTTPKKIIELWKSYGNTYDDIIGLEPELLKEVLGYQSNEQTEKELDELIIHFEDLNNSFPDFFKTYDLEWSLFKEVYRLPMEAELQGRLLHFLLTLWHLDPNYLQNINKTIAVRYTISSKIHKISPRAICIDDCNAILTPVHSVSAFYYQIGCMVESDQNADTLIKDYGLKILCNQIISDLLLEHSKLIHPIRVFAHGQIIYDLVKAEIPFFSDSNSTESQVKINTKWKDLNYLAVNFSLAHELIHILKNEHVPGVTPDEFEADHFAIEVLANTMFYKECLHSNDLKGSEVLPEISALSFICMMNLQVQIENQLLGNSGYNLAELEKRLNRAKSLDISFAPMKDQSIFIQVTQTFNKLSKTFRENIDPINDYKKQINGIAQDYFMNSNL